jgi:hypothetical protein
VVFGGAWRRGVEKLVLSEEPKSATTAAVAHYPMFSRFDPVELAGSAPGVAAVPSTEFQIPILPVGRSLVVNIISTWYECPRKLVVDPSVSLFGNSLWG